MVSSLVDLENAVAVAVQRQRAAMGGHVAPQAVQVGVGALHRVEARLHQLPGGIVNEGDQAAFACAVFKPGVGTAVNLHQLAQAAAPLTGAVNAPGLRALGLP